MPLSVAEHKKLDKSRGLTHEDLTEHHLQKFVASVNEHLAAHSFFHVEGKKKIYLGFEAYLETSWMTPSIAKRVANLYGESGWKSSAVLEDGHIHLTLDLPKEEREDAKKPGKKAKTPRPSVMHSGPISYKKKETR